MPAAITIRNPLWRVSQAFFPVNQGFELSQAPRSYSGAPQLCRINAQVLTICPFQAYAWRFPHIRPQHGQTSTLGSLMMFLVPPKKSLRNGSFRIESKQNGLGKHIALAFDDDNKLDDLETFWVAQTGTKVVLKESVPNRAILDKRVAVAKSEDRATEFDITGVALG